jgi:hypothetical protein
MTSDGRYIGKVKTIGDGGQYGFISCDATYAEFNKDIYVSRSVLGDKAEEGTEITFLVEEREDGKPRATDVQIDGVPQSKKGAGGKGKSKGKGGDKGDKGGKGKGKGKDAPKEVPAKIVPAKEGFVPITVPPKDGHLPLPVKPGFHIPVQVPPPAKFLPMQVPPKALMPGSVVPPPPKIGMFPGQIPIVLPGPKGPVAPGALPAMPMELFVASSKAKISAPDPMPVPAKAAIDASMAASAPASASATAPAMEFTTAQAPALPVELSAASTKKASPARPPE